MPKIAKAVPYILLVVSLCLYLIFLYWHLSLGLTRYFDADEFAHLHWAARMLSGSRPYVDFQTFFPPGFALSLMPVFIGSWGTTTPLIAARIMTFFVFMGITFMSMLIFFRQRGSIWGAVLAGAFLAFLPLPFDKYLEVRPDNLATLLVLTAMYAQIRWMESYKNANKIKNLRIWSLVCGLFYSLSYLVLPKTLPNIGIGVILAIFFVLGHTSGKTVNRLQKSIQELRWGIIGLVVPVLIFAIWVLTLGNPGLVWYSLFTLPVEANKISKYFVMMQDLFFYPNGIYYGQDGWSRGLLVNMGFWVTGFSMAAYRLVTPWKIAAGDRKKAYGEMLISLQFWIQMAFFVEYVPLKHPQYLIPIGVFIAWYCADLLLALYRFIMHLRIMKIIFAVFYIVSAFYLYGVFTEVNTAKLGWTNTDLLNETQKAYKLIPQNQPVLDLVGQMMYNPDAYYACCIPFGQSAEFMSRPLPDLPAVLEENQTKYITQIGLPRTDTLPWNWRDYIARNFEPYQGDKSILTRKN